MMVYFKTMVYYTDCVTNNPRVGVGPVSCHCSNNPFANNLCVFDYSCSSYIKSASVFVHVQLFKSSVRYGMVDLSYLIVLVYTGFNSVFLLLVSMP